MKRRRITEKQIEDIELNSDDSEEEYDESDDYDYNDSFLEDDRGNTIPIQKVDKKYEKKMDEIKNSTSNNNSLKLKRTKPLKRNHNNLESALGLIITPKT